MSSFNTTTAWVMLAFLTFMLLTITIIAFIYHKKQKGCDAPNWASLALFIISTIDFLTDILFFSELAIQNHELAVYFAIFFFIPHILSNIFCIVYIIRSKYYAKPPPLNVEWITQHDKLLILLTFFGSFYSTIEIMNTKLFHLNIFNMQITNRNRNQIHLMHVINDILFGSFPLMIIQMAYMSMNVYIDISIAVIAMLFSFTSIAIAIFFIVSRLCNNLVDLLIPTNENNDNENPKDKASTIYRLMTCKSSKLTESNIFCHQLITTAWSSSLQLSEYQVKTVFIDKIYSSNNERFVGIRCKIKIKPEVSDENLFLLLNLLENNSSGAYDILKQDINIKLGLNDNNLQLFVERTTKNIGMKGVENKIDFAFGDVVNKEIGDQTWKCPACTFENHYLIEQCEICKSAKPIYNNHFDQIDHDINEDNNILIDNHHANNNNNDAIYVDAIDNINNEPVIPIINEHDNNNNNNNNNVIIDDARFSMIINKKKNNKFDNINEEKQLFKDIENENKELSQEKDGGLWTGDLLIPKNDEIDDISNNINIEQKEMDEKHEYDIEVSIDIDDNEQKIDIPMAEIPIAEIPIAEIPIAEIPIVANNNSNSNNTETQNNMFEISEIHEDEHDIIVPQSVAQSVPESIPKSLISVQQFDDDQEDDMKQVEVDLFDNNITDDGLNNDFDGLNNDFDDLRDDVFGD